MKSNKAEKSASQWTLFKRILSLAKFQQHWMILAIFMTIFQSVITAFQPYLYKMVIDSVIIPKQFHLLEKWALILLGWLLLQAALGFANSYLSESIAQSVILKLRQYVYDHLTRLKLSFYDKTPVGTAVTRSISDIQTITDLFSSGVITIAGDLIQIVVILGCMFYMDVKLTLITLTVVPLLLFAANRFRKGIRDTFQDVRNQVAKLNAFLQERITGMQMVQLFNREKEEMRRFDQINQAHRDANIRSIYYYAIFFPIVEVLVACSFALIVWYGSGALVQGSIEFGELTAFIMFINLFFRPVRAIADRFNNIQMGIVAADRIFKLIDDTFQTQLRAILRASKHGPIKLLIPMLAHAHEIDQTLAALEQAKASLRKEKIAFDEKIQVGGMIEIPAAALAIGLFLRRLDFLSIGTNDLIQYTLAIDRSDEQVASLYDPLHPAVLMLIAHTLASAEKVNIPVSVCGEMAGDPKLTRLFLGMGLRIFSMHPTQILKIKNRVLKANVEEIAPTVRRMLRLEEPGKLQEALEKLNS